MVQTAFKEWAVIVEALGQGEQIVILRKGGIAEGRGGFQAEHERFWLFPTRFHQQAEGVVPEAATRFGAMLFPPEDVLRIQYAAEVVKARRLESLAAAKRLAGQHIWRDDVIAERFDWGRDQGIYAMAVRIRQLASPLDLPMLEEYGGCKSWIELGPAMDFSTTKPVLEAAVFEQKLADFREALA